MIALLAQTANVTGTYTTTEWDIPRSLPLILAWSCGLVLLLGTVIVIYRRDTSRLAIGWRVWLTVLRLGVIAAVVGIMLNPHERTQRSTLQPSEIVIAIDTSLSMAEPAVDADSSDSVASRAQAVRTAFEDHQLIESLRRRHALSVYTFDESLSGPHIRQSTGTPDARPDWDEVLRPRGQETRLGESITDLIGRVASPTLSGIVVISDGAANAGLDVSSANQQARTTRTRLISVGTGALKRPRSIRIANVRSPTDVHSGDPFRISAFLQGQSVAGSEATVTLLSRAEGSLQEPESVASKAVTMSEDGVPVEARFEERSTSPGGIEYTLRVDLPGVTDGPKRKPNDKEDPRLVRRRTIVVSDKQIRVLLIAGGPSRDYRFVRNMLFRHTGMQLDVWLQTVEAATAAGVSQDASAILTEFPSQKPKLFEYDAIVAFDADWMRHKPADKSPRGITAEQLDWMREWVTDRAGGVIFVAGPIHTPRVVSENALETIRDLLPVYLNPFMTDLQINRRNTQPWALELTADGREAPFLALGDNAVATAALWNDFSGVHRSYPTAGIKDAAVPLAYFTSPRAQTEHGKPILLASQFFGAGRCLFLGSSEIWRLRSVSEDAFNRFWTKAVRDVAQGRISHGNQRGMLMMGRTEFSTGQSVRVRAQLYDAALDPLELERIPMAITTPSGTLLSPTRDLLRDAARPGQYVGSFRAAAEGDWNIEVPIPDSPESLTQRIEVVAPNLETANPQQNVKLLEALVRDTGGRYLPISEVSNLPDLLPDRSESVMIDERLRPLWDRHWVLFTMIGLLALEWITRKLLKLA